MLTGLNAADIGEATSFDAFYDRAVQGWSDDFDVSRAVIGVTGLDDGWAVMVEVNGYVGVTERLIGPMSPGRTIVSHFRNINAAYSFHWWHDGQHMVNFDLMFPAESRFGAEPDALNDDIRGAGIPWRSTADHDLDFDYSAAGFALTQRITGVACTPRLFEDSAFRMATVDLPDSSDDQRYGDVLRTTWRHPEVW